MNLHILSKNITLFLQHDQVNCLDKEKNRNNFFGHTIPGECVRGMDIEIPDTRTNSREGKYILKMW